MRKEIYVAVWEEADLAQGSKTGTVRIDKSIRKTFLMLLALLHIFLFYKINYLKYFRKIITFPF